MKHLLTEQPKVDTLPGHLDLLRLISPPQTIIHIGAGYGNGDMTAWREWQIPYALIIDADESRLDWVNTQVPNNPDWQVCCAVLADIDGEAEYYSISNPAEDGLLAAEQLTALWPNLQTNKQVTRQVTRLDSLLAKHPTTLLPTSASLWTFIDCLSSLTILKGADKALEQSSVLCLRVLLQPLPDQNTIGTLQDIEAYLQPYGYRCIQITESNNPAIGVALFVRDWQGLLAPELLKISHEKAAIVSEQLTLQQQLTQQTATNNELNKQVHDLAKTAEEQANLATEREARIDNLAQESTTHSQQAQQLQSQVDTLNQAHTVLAEEKTTAIQSRDALSIELATMTQSRDEQTQLAAERQAQIETLAQEQNHQAQQAQQLQSQVNGLNQAHTVLAEEKNTVTQSRDTLSIELAAMAQSRDEQAHLAAERQTQIETLVHERNNHAQQAQENQLQVEALNQEKSGLIELRDTLTNDIASLTQARDVQTNRVNECQNRLEAITQERDHQVTHAQNLQSQVDALSQTNSLLNQEKSTFAEQQEPLKNELAALKQSVDQQALSLSQSHTECEQLHNQLQQQEAIMANLKAHYSESDARQRLLNDEILKAEAQLELIKDVLLREPGL
jgi:uncharacterized coiled-coil DUF342 family protein